MPCPYAERRGAVVFCRAANRVVNPFVMPCLSERYTRCRFFQEAQKRATTAAPAPPPAEEERAALPVIIERLRRERTERPEAPTPPPPPPPPARPEAAATTPEQRAAETEAKPTPTPQPLPQPTRAEEKPAQPPPPPSPPPPAPARPAEAQPSSPPQPSAGEVRWSREESEKLIDPAYMATIILRAPLALRRTFNVSDLDDLARRLELNIDGWRSGCYLVDVRGSSGRIYLKYCDGSLVASATESEVLEPEKAREAVKGTLRVTVYGPLKE